MTLKPCSREKEIAQLLALGLAPESLAPELKAHLSACRSCADLALVTVSFQRAREQAARVAPLGSAGALWWRAQLRRRNAAVERVGKPILGAHIFALSINLLAVVVLVVSQARQGLGWLTWLQQLSQAGALHLGALWQPELLSSNWIVALLMPMLAALALVGGIAVYLASEKQ